MRLYSIRGGNKQSLYNREYTIGIGISLGNKWFRPENVFSLVQWALNYTKDFVVIYVADSIHSINIETRNKKTPETAVRRAVQQGTELLKQIETLTRSQLTSEEFHKLVFAHWQDLEDENYRKKVECVYEEYSQNQEFKQTIDSIVIEKLQREKRSCFPARITKLATYVLEELPELVVRVPISGYSVDASIYPFDSEIFQIAEQIQLGGIFPKIKEKIFDTEPKIFLEVR